MVSALIIASLILLIPSYLLAVTKYNSISAQVATQLSGQGTSSQENEIDAKVQDVNKKVSLFLGQSSGRLVLPDIIVKIIAMKDAAIKIQGFSYDASTRQERFVISGIAGDRDGLARFVETLKRSAIFTNVDLPVSSYVKSTNIDFAITATRDMGGANTKQ